MWSSLSLWWLQRSRRWWRTGGDKREGIHDRLRYGADMLSHEEMEDVRLVRTKRFESFRTTKGCAVIAERRSSVIKRYFKSDNPTYQEREETKGV